MNCLICGQYRKNMRHHVEGVHKNMVIPMHLCMCGKCNKFIPFYHKVIQGHGGGIKNKEGATLSNKEVFTNGKLCKCNCGKLLDERSIYDYIMHHKPKKLTQSLCACECGEWANPGCKYINGHSRHGKATPIKTRNLQSSTQKGRDRTPEHTENIKKGMHESGAPEKISQAMMGNQNGLGAYHSPESIEKSRQANLGQKRSKDTCQKLKVATTNYWNSLSEEEKNLRIIPFIEAGLKSQKYFNTSIERIMKGIFEKFNITYVQSKRIGRRWVDFYLPAKNMVVECDGTYWHGSPEAKENDKRKDEFVRARGYRVKRLPEARIRELADIHDIKY